jgi:hypothetical protein
MINQKDIVGAKQLKLEHSFKEQQDGTSHTHTLLGL